MHGCTRNNATQTMAQALDLLAWAHQRVRNRPEEFRIAGRCLDMAYSEASIRDRRRIFEEHGETVGHFVSASQICVDDDSAGPLVLQARLSSAVIDLIGCPPDMTPLAAEDPLVQARLVVLVSCLATDREAGQYCEGITELGSLVWLDDRTRGRAMVAPEAADLPSWGMVELLDEARACLARRDALGAPDACKPGADPACPATLADLVRSVIAAECGTEYFLSIYAEAGRLLGIHGPFKNEHLPEYRSVVEAYRAHRVASDRDAMRQREEEVPDVMFYAPDQWEVILDEYIDAYQEFVAKAEHAMAAVAACALHGMRTVPVLPEGFLLDLGTTLRFILGTWHPTSLGPRGLGAIRTGCREVPEEFVEHLRELQRRRVALQGVVVAPDAAVSGARSLAPGHQRDEPAEDQRRASESDDASPCFVKRGNVWDVRFGEESGMFGHLDGMTYINGLLRKPNPSQDFHAVDVLRWKSDSAAPKSETEPFEDDKLHEGGTGTPLADAEAIAAYKARLAIVNDELCENKNNLTFDEQVCFEQERTFLSETLGEALGLSGRQREFQRSEEEKARKRVSQAIARSTEKFRKEGMPELADHLRLHLTPSGYRPGPNPPPWSLNGM